MAGGRHRGGPQRVDRHSVTSLESIPERASQERRGPGGPREQHIRQQNRSVRKFEKRGKIQPDLLSQGAVEEQVLKRLTVTGAHVTENILRIQPRKVSLASADRQRVEQDLVEGFPLLRCGRRTPYPTPQILWGISKTGNGASIPVQSTVNLLSIVDEPAGAGGGEIRE